MSLVNRNTNQPIRGEEPRGAPADQASDITPTGDDSPLQPTGNRLRRLRDLHLPEDLVEVCLTDQPTVCCVMLANGRREMVARAVRAFHAQTYREKELLIWNTGERGEFDEHDAGDVTVCFEDVKAVSLGRLRNHANSVTGPSPCGIDAEILIHWDSDDWSHPNRIAEQVALLQQTGADAVGYHEMLFWDSRAGSQGCSCCGTTPCRQHPVSVGGEAWLYRCPNPTIVPGTTLAYWRKTWERKPFVDRHTAEDIAWVTGLKVRGVTSLTPEPRVIASIHGGNTCSQVDLSGRIKCWWRAPQWDEHCRQVMSLEQRRPVVTNPDLRGSEI